IALWYWSGTPLAWVGRKFRQGASISVRTRSSPAESLCGHAAAVNTQPITSVFRNPVLSTALIFYETRCEAALFLFHPDFVTLGVSGGVSDGLVPGNAHRPGNWFDDLLQLPANILAVSAIHCVGLDLVDEPALLAGNHNHAGKMRIALDWFVLKVDEVRRDKNKKENQRDHDVVVQAAPVVRQENVAANCAPDRAHWGDGEI